MIFSWSPIAKTDMDVINRTKSKNKNNSCLIIQNAVMRLRQPSLLKIDRARLRRRVDTSSQITQITIHQRERTIRGLLCRIHSQHRAATWVVWTRDPYPFPMSHYIRHVGAPRDYCFQIYSAHSIWQSFPVIVFTPTLVPKLFFV